MRDFYGRFGLIVLGLGIWGGNVYYFFCFLIMVYGEFVFWRVGFVFWRVGFVFLRGGFLVKLLICLIGLLGYYLEVLFF